MLAGPAALAVALLVLPGWVYWRLEASPRTARTQLGELLAVVGAGSVASGLTFLIYITIVHHPPVRALDGELLDPARLSGAYLRHHVELATWSASAFVVTACMAALVGASAQRGLRRRRDGDRTTYDPETPLWVKTLGSVDAVITVDLRDGTRVTGYLGGHSIEEDATPSIYLTPPIEVRRPGTSVGWRQPRAPAPEIYGANAVTIPGADIRMVWTGYADR